MANTMIMCFGDGCPLKEDCMRSDKTNSWQQWFQISPYKNHSCEHHIAYPKPVAEAKAEAPKPVEKKPVVKRKKAAAKVKAVKK